MNENLMVLPGNEHLFKMLRDRDLIFKTRPEYIYPWWRRPCRVKVLLLTDNLDFSTGDFGLSTFVSILENDGRSYVDFEITIAHRSSTVGDPGVPVARSIPNFRFTDASHFNESMYDQVWLFGIGGVGLSEKELFILSAFMNNGGGVFATGDHGSLGQSLCGNITRVRKMRHWDSFGSPDEVSMGGVRRNDTNRIGRDAGSQFDDQSDDIPQTIQPKLYSSAINAFLKETYPHPLLCCPLGIINVLPDHPHEGECTVPKDLSGTYLDGTAEFPGGISPELIAFSTVPAGNTAGTKEATQSHSFGAISAYDGYKANVGRIVTDATWHHFVNVNLIGALGIPDTSVKGMGFLASVSGQEHLKKIKHYYINIAVWLSRKSQLSCFTSRTLWHLVYQHRVMEATMDNPTLVTAKITPQLLYAIGSHATDVLGKEAGQCRKIQVFIDILTPILPEIIPIIDPWITIDRNKLFKNPLPWVDLNPLFSIVMGSGIVALRDKFQNENFSGEKVESEQILQVFLEGAKRGVELSVKEFNAHTKAIMSALT